MGLSASVSVIGKDTSNLGVNIWRDGGGGGIINGLNVVWFSDGIWTGPGDTPVDACNLDIPGCTWGPYGNFTSNSIALHRCTHSSCLDDPGFKGSDVHNMHDFDGGDRNKGPRQQIPYYYDEGETDGTHGIWPNQNLATLCDGGCGVSFPDVVSRQPPNLGYAVYNTPVKVEIGAFGPVATRPVKALFYADEPRYGTYTSLVGIDGYLYTYAKLSETSPNNNGLKLARVKWGQWAERSAYEYWNGNAYTSTIPALDDGGVSNVLRWNSNQFGKDYGPGYGDIFYSQLAGMYVNLFQSGAPALDDNLYISYSGSPEGGWTEPQAIWQIPRHSDGYSYSFHAYPHLDPTGTQIPISWNKFRDANGTIGQYDVYWATITFTKTA